VDPTRIRLRDEGVYPVRVELRVAGGGPVLDRFTTHLVYAQAPTEGGVPLELALVLPLAAPPALQPDGTRALDAGGAARLATLVQALDAHPSVPAVLDVSPETLEALVASPSEADRSTAAAVARTASTRQLVNGSYVAVAPGAYSGPPGEAEFATQLDRGRAVLDQLAGSRPDGRTWVTEEHLDEGALDRLRGQQVDRVVVPNAALSPVDLPVTLAQPFELQAKPPRRPLALAADDDLAAHFRPAPPGEGAPAKDDVVLRAHQFLADLAVVYFDRPGKRRGVVALAPREWGAERPFLDALLGALGSSPIVRSTSLDDLFATVPPVLVGRATLTRSLVPGPPPAALSLSGVRAARARIEGFGAMLDPDNPLDDELDKILLASQAADLRLRQRSTYLRAVEKRLDDELHRIVVPPSRSVTHTARRGTIPVTIQRQSDYPVHLVVRLSSDKLTFPNGDSRRVDLTRRNTTERFVVQARTSGAFPLRITLATPAGDVTVARSRVTVRSTAASGVGVGLSVGAGAVLLVWWARHLVRGRRNRRLVPA
jgi:hypothetical protein